MRNGLIDPFENLFCCCPRRTPNSSTRGIGNLRSILGVQGFGQSFGQIELAVGFRFVFTSFFHIRSRKTEEELAMCTVATNVRDSALKGLCPVAIHDVESEGEVEEDGEAVSAPPSGDKVGVHFSWPKVPRLVLVNG